MSNPYDDVWDFHTAFDLTRSKTPALPTSDIRKLRASLLLEEFNEYQKAEAEDDIVEIADALADIVYIAYGTAIAYGIPLDRVFDEVHRSNMAKLVDGKAVRREDGKVLKPASWNPPDILGVLNGK